MPFPRGRCITASIARKDWENFCRWYPAKWKMYKLMIGSFAIVLLPKPRFPSSRRALHILWIREEPYPTVVEWSDSDYRVYFHYKQSVLEKLF